MVKYSAKAMMLCVVLYVTCSSQLLALGGCPGIAAVPAKKEILKTIVENKEIFRPVLADLKAAKESGNFLTIQSSDGKLKWEAYVLEADPQVESRWTKAEDKLKAKLKTMGFPLSRDLVLRERLDTDVDFIYEGICVMAQSCIMTGVAGGLAALTWHMAPPLNAPLGYTMSAGLFGAGTAGLYFSYNLFLNSRTKTSTIDQADLKDHIRQYLLNPSLQNSDGMPTPLIFFGRNSQDITDIKNALTQLEFSAG